MSNIQTFNNSSLGKCRVIGNQENPLFCLKDVCDVLEMQNQNNVKNSIQDEFGDGVCLTYPIVDNLGRTQQATFIWVLKNHLLKFFLTFYFFILDNKAVKENQKVVYHSPRMWHFLSKITLLGFLVCSVVSAYREVCGKLPFGLFDNTAGLFLSVKIKKVKKTKGE